MRQSELIRAGDYLAVPKWLAARADLPATAKLMWASLANRLGDNETTWPNQSTVAADLGVDEDTVGEAGRRLRAAGLLSWRRTRVGNVYCLSLPAPDTENFGNRETPGNKPEKTGLDTEKDRLASGETPVSFREKTGQNYTRNDTRNDTKNDTRNKDGAAPPPVASEPSGQSAEITSSTSPQTSKPKAHNGASLAKLLVERVNGLRASLGDCPLIGVDYVRLGAAMKRWLVATPAEEIVALIDGLVAHWPAVAAACRWMKPPPVPDEHSLFNSKIVESLRAAMSAPRNPQPEGNPYAVYKF